MSDEINNFEHKQLEYQFSMEIFLSDWTWWIVKKVNVTRNVHPIFVVQQEHGKHPEWEGPWAEVDLEQWLLSHII